MKIKIPIKTEGEEIKKALEDATRKKHGPLTRNEIIRIKKHVHKQMVRRAKIKAVLAALGIGSIAIGTKVLNPGGNETPKVKKESDYFADQSKRDSHKSFVERHQVETEESIEDKIKNLSDEEELLEYIKELYIQAREEKMIQDDSSVNDINDIKILLGHENALWKTDTGEFITHGDYPEQTLENLKNQGINVIDSKENAVVYKVLTNNGEIIDCVTMENINGKSTPIKVKIGDDYKDYESVLEGIGNVVPAGIEFYTHFDDELAKQNFIEAVKELKGINIEEEQGVHWANDNDTKEQDDEPQL